MNGLVRPRRALVSVSDKSGLVDFVRVLVGYGVEIISTGGTAKVMRDAGIEVKDVSEETGFPEMMGGRLKTIHPNIHGAILGVRDDPGHAKSMEDHGMAAIDIVVVNFYPFAETVAKPDVTAASAIEEIDIGGPAMVRSAAKNSWFVTVVTNPYQYHDLVDVMKRHDGQIDAYTRLRLAGVAFRVTAAYDVMISGFLDQHVTTDEENDGSFIIRPDDE